MSRVLAFDVGGTHLRGALVERGLVVGEPASCRTPLGDGAALVAAIAGLGAELCARPGPPPLAVGLAIAGTLDTRAGLLRCSPNFGVQDLALSAPLQAALGLPVSLINDVNAAALGEARARGCDDLAAVLLGTGVGTGFVSGGHPVLGHRGMAGEGGHLIHDPAGEPCPAGCRGCFEAHLGGAALGRAAAAAGLGDCSADLLAAWRAGDERARPAVTRALDAARALACLIVNAFDPQVIVFGGGLGSAFPEALAAAREGVAGNPLGSGRRDVPVEPNRLGDRAGLLGAAAATSRG